MVKKNKSIALDVFLDIRKNKNSLPHQKIYKTIAED